MTIVKQNLKMTSTKAKKVYSVNIPIKAELNLLKNHCVTKMNLILLIVQHYIKAELNLFKNHCVTKMNLTPLIVQIFL